VLSCSRDVKKIKTDNISAYTSELKLDIDDFDALLFIPLEGCGICIEGAIDFYKSNKQNTSILYIFCTCKPHNYPFLNDTESVNVFIDKKNAAINYEILTTAPVAYFKKDDAFIIKQMENKNDYHLFYQ